MNKQVNGVKKKVVSSLQKPSLLGIYSYGELPVKSNKQLSNDLGESPSNISYATKKLKQDDVIKDIEIWEGDKTGFQLKDDITTYKSYEFDSIIDNTAKVHAISLVFIFIYSTMFANQVFRSSGIFLTVFLAGMMGFIPPFVYNFYNVLTSLNSYKMVIESKK